VKVLIASDGPWPYISSRPSGEETDTPVIVCTVPPQSRPRQLGALELRRLPIKFFLAVTGITDQKNPQMQNRTGISEGSAAISDVICRSRTATVQSENRQHRRVSAYQFI
jgi:hypothetical protein